MKKISLFVLFVFATSPSLWACPMCADIIERGKDALAAMRFGEGIAWSILLLLSVLFSLVGGFVYVIWKSNRKTVNERQDHGART